MILKVAKNFRETVFRGVELIKVELMWLRQRWRHNDIQWKILNKVEKVRFPLGKIKMRWRQGVPLKSDKFDENGESPNEVVMLHLLLKMANNTFFV